MAKTTGMGDRLFVAGFDLSGDVGAITTLRGSHSVADVTGISSSAMERIGVLRDGELSFNSFWNVATGGAVPVLNDLPATDIVAEYHHGATASAPAAGITGKQMDYSIDIPADGVTTGTTQILGNGFGVEWGYSLTTGNQAFTTGTTYGSDCDDLAGSPVSTAFGACLYVQLIDIAGGNVTISAVHGAAAAPTTAIAGCTTTALTSPGAYRLPSTSATETILRYTRLKVVSSTSSLHAVAMLVRYRAAIS